MKIIISPAKRMVLDLDGIEVLGLPKFYKEAKYLREYLKTLNYNELKNLWECNDKITIENIDRLEKLKLEGPLTPAVLSYDGIAYKNMAPSVFTYKEWEYIDNNLFILSGLYGALKPREGVIPYRLEMQAKIDIDGYNSLYKFWGDKIYNRIIEEDNIIINLASKEYSDSIKPYINGNVKMIDIVFAERKNDKLITKPTEAKANRGAMVRYMAENNISNIEDIKKYNLNNYKYSIEESNELTYFFIKG